MKFFKNNNILTFFYKHFLCYPTPVNLNYFWNFGSLALFVLFIQIVTGILLALWYIPSIDMAFWSVSFIMREVNYGWLLRYMHANGASFFFFVVYFHIGRGIFYGSYIYPREKVWFSGAILFILMIATAFFGYVLPWGQMSYWAATVISSLASTIPFIGQNVLLFIWGGVSIDQPTLTRIYGLHFLFPFIILFFSLLHLILLHEHGSTNPLGIEIYDKVPFHPYYTIKDILGVIFFLFFYFFFVFFSPNFFSHSDNYIPANPGVTPSHIVPEWYFLPFYGILRSVPNKLGGILILVLAFFFFVFFPLFSNPLVRSGSFRPLFQHLFWIFVVTYILLGWSGGNPVSTPYYEICQLGTLFYFLFFILFNPLCILIEKELYIIYLIKINDVILSVSEESMIFNVSLKDIFFQESKSNQDSTSSTVCAIESESGTSVPKIDY